MGGAAGRGPLQLYAAWRQGAGQAGGAAVPGALRGRVGGGAEPYTCYTILVLASAMMGWDKLDGRWQALFGHLLLEGKNKAADEGGF